MSKSVAVAALEPGMKVRVGRSGVWEVVSVKAARFPSLAPGWLQITWAHGPQSCPMSPLTELEVL